MKKIILFISLIVSYSSFSQCKTEVEKLLIEKFTKKGGSIALNTWTYNQGSIYTFTLPLTSSKLKSIAFYKTSFMFTGDIESWSEDCLIMFDNDNNEVIILPQTVLEKDFYKKFIGIVFKNNNEIKKFAEEFSSVILNKNNDDEELFVLKNLIIDIDLIKFEISFSHQKETHDIIEVLLNKNQIAEIRRLNNKSKKIELSIK